MYSTLIGLLAIRKIAKATLASKMGINRGTLDNKLGGKSRFSLSEMFFIQQKFFPDLTEEEIFKFDERTA